MSTPPTETDAIQDKKRKGCFSCPGCIVITLLLAVLFAVLFRAVQGEREAARRMQCVPKALASVGFWNYHYVNESFPPAYTTDADGKPLHSWRVLISPYIEQRELYDQIHLDERGTVRITRSFMIKCQARIIAQADP